VLSTGLAALKTLTQQCAAGDFGAAIDAIEPVMTAGPISADALNLLDHSQALTGGGCTDDQCA
jgi:hypothetical protein